MLITAAVPAAVDGMVYMVLLSQGTQDVRVLYDRQVTHAVAGLGGVRGVCGGLLWRAHRAAVF